MSSPFERALGAGMARPRVLVIAAHPDDETIGAAGLLQHLAATDVPVGVAHLTDGAPADMADARLHGFTSAREYALARRRELARALRCLPRRVERFALGFRDQGLSHELSACVQAVSRLIDAWGPSVVISHPYEGGHPDHDAAAFAVSAALAMNARVTAGHAPLLLEFTSYHLWNGTLRSGTFLENGGPRVIAVPLNRRERNVKRRMLECFGTQQRTLTQFGVLDEESFRPAPSYDFRHPAQGGTLLYELFAWGTDGAAWRARAAAALEHSKAACR